MSGNQCLAQAEAAVAARNFKWRGGGKVKLQNQSSGDVQRFGNVVQSYESCQWSRSEIFRFQARVLGDAGKHLGPDFFGVVEGPSELAPRGVGKLDVGRTFACLYRPPSSEEGVKDFAGFGARPVTHLQQVMDTSRGLLFFSFSI